MPSDPGAPYSTCLEFCSQVNFQTSLHHIIYKNEKLDKLYLKFVDQSVKKSGKERKKKAVY